MAKNAVLIIYTLLTVLFSQAQNSNPKIYIRLKHDQSKIAGKLVAVTDSNITLRNGKSSDSIITVREISSVRIKNSFGKNALIIGGITGGSLAIAGLFIGEKAKNDGTIGGALHDAWVPTADEAAVGGLVMGLAAGTASAGIISGARGKMKFKINGDPASWQVALAKIKTTAGMP